MSWSREMSFVGTRKSTEDWAGTISCPTGYKYLTVVGEMLGMPQLAYIGSNTYVGAGFSGDDVDANETGTNQYVTSGDGAAPTEITPVKVKNMKNTYFVKNNYSTTVTLTMYEIHPKNVIPTALEAVGTGFADPMHFMFKAVLEGIADKLSVDAVQTQGACMVHTAAPYSGTAISAIRGVSYNELSLKPPLTIFDSSIMGQWFSIVNVQEALLKPGDELTYIVKNGDQMFLDGIEPYVSVGALAYPFSKFVVFQVVGHVGYESTPHGFGFEAAASASTNRHAAQKQGSVNVNFSPGELSVYCIMETEYDVYDGKLIEPITGMIMNSARAADDMKDAITTVVADIE